MISGRDARQGLTALSPRRASADSAAQRLTVYPPLTGMVCPVIHEASGLASRATMGATSDGRPRRRTMY